MDHLCELIDYVIDMVLLLICELWKFEKTDMTVFLDDCVGWDFDELRVKKMWIV